MFFLTLSSRKGLRFSGAQPPILARETSVRSSVYKLIMTEVLRNLRNIFFSQKIPTFSKKKLDFFTKKKFFADFPKYGTFIYYKLIMSKF